MSSTQLRMRVHGVLIMMPLQRGMRSLQKSMFWSAALEVSEPDTSSMCSCLHGDQEWSRYELGFLHLKGNWRENISWLRNVKNVQICPSAGFIRLRVLSIFIHKSYLFASTLSSSGCSHVGSLFTNEEQKMFGSWHINTIAIHSSLASDVNDTGC